MMTKRSIATLLVLLIGWNSPSPGEVQFDWVTVGNPGNAPDDTGFGAVDYSFRISKYEVTNDQYVEFLNAVASDDPFRPFLAYFATLGSPLDVVRSGEPGSYSYTVREGFGSKPARGVSGLQAMQFVNWLENGQPVGTPGATTTDSGVYLLPGLGAGIGDREPGASYFLPTEDEWYKAAYHDPTSPTGYWNYPTRSDTPPQADLPPGGRNSANGRGADRLNPNPTTTDVGSFINAPSFYGTFDQAGNVFEFTESLDGEFFSVLRGGSWADEIHLYATADQPLPISWMTVSPLFEGGFRVAGSISVPEPSSQPLLLSGIALAMFGLRRRRRIYALQPNAMCKNE